MTPTEWGVVTILAVGLGTIAAHEVWAWRAIRKHRREERQLLALYQRRVAAGPGLPGDGAGMLTGHDHHVLREVEMDSMGDVPEPVYPAQRDGRRGQ